MMMMMESMTRKVRREKEDFFSIEDQSDSDDLCSVPGLLHSSPPSPHFLVEEYFCIKFCETFAGLGAGLAWIAAHRNPISINVTDIGSPTTNVTASITNTNTPTNTQTQTNSNTATNTNNDQDTITQSETNTNTNNANTNCVCVCDGVSCTCTNCG